MSLFQNPVGFSQAFMVSRPTAYKTTIFQSCCFKTKVLKQPRIKEGIMDLFSVGEMVIDFLPGAEGGGYIRYPGGGCANVAIAAARNGLDAGFCGKLGDDDFGYYLAGVLKKNGVKRLCPAFTSEAFTTLAFVSLNEKGERSFSFARKPGADSLLRKDDIRTEDIKHSIAV
jgi:sugar/nucleoside kinase (ribokinase family)